MNTSSTTEAVPTAQVFDASQMHQQLCAMAGIAFVVLFGVGFWAFAQYLPPHSPAAGSEYIAAIYRDHTGMIRVGQLVLMIGAALMVPFDVGISVQLERIEPAPKMLSRVQMASGIVASLTILLPSLLWTTAAFRPERAPEITQVLNDLGWITMLMTFPPFVVQMTAIGLGILADRRPQPLLPRWLGFLSFWVAILLVPGGLITFAKTGAFAWDGLWGFWVPAIAFFLWVLAMSIQLFRAIRR
jgi:hypothetical protein